MIRVLILKDLARLRVNWRGMVVLLAMPLCITALVGAVFGPASEGEMPRIQLAVVNEDDHVIGGVFAGVANSEQSREYLDVSVLDRKEALQQLRDNKLSAVVILPEGFSDRLLAGDVAPDIELVKNPAQRYMPAITEELLRVVAEFLNAVAIHLLADLPELAAIVNEEDALDLGKSLRIVEQVGERLSAAEPFLFPPIIGVEKSTLQAAQDESPSWNVFGFLMPGLVSVFLLLTAEGTTRDLFLENRNKTLDRFRTFRAQLFPFLLSKSLYSTVVVAVSAGIMLGGGGVVFRVVWQQPGAIAAVTLSYTVFCVGFAYFLTAVIYREQLAAILNTAVIMLMGFVGGSVVPSHQLPALLRDSISPWMPNHLFAEAVKQIQFGMSGPHWTVPAGRLVLMGVCLLALATVLLKRRVQGAA